MKIRLQSKKAAILVITLWIISLLSAVALSLTYRIGLELKMAGSEMDRDKAFCIAKAGVVQAIGVLNQDHNGYDALNEQWSNCSEELYGINLFNGINIGEGRFTVSYVYGQDIFSGQQNILYGMQDEERKININKAKQDVLESLSGMTPEIATSICAWRGDQDLAPDVLLKEDSYYQGLEKPYKRKGKEIQCIEELVLIRGVTPDTIFGKDMDGDGQININEAGLVRYLTIYGDGLVNINTADVPVLRAIGFTEDLCNKVVNYRAGPDEILGTSDDGVFTDVTKIAETLNYYDPLLPAEQELITAKQALFKVSSRYYKAGVESEIQGKVKVRVSAIIDKESSEGSQIIRWDED